MKGNTDTVNTISNNLQQHNTNAEKTNRIPAQCYSQDFINQQRPRPIKTLPLSLLH